VQRIGPDKDIHHVGRTLCIDHSRNGIGHILLYPLA
jgi:hypothetical protein